MREFFDRITGWKTDKKNMLIELADIGLNAEAQKPLKVLYKGQIVGDFVADVVVTTQ